MMIIVTGSVVIEGGKLEQALVLSQEHVVRSRAERGCISHCVQIDNENPQQLSFIEQWADRQALLAHFAVPASQGFVQSLSALANSVPIMKIYDANEISIADLAS
ncbi:MAG: quinol monooxygenase YgiN [Pseudomonadales bacterium]|jgi:quinol monooxygenase YgiN